MDQAQPERSATIGQRGSDAGAVGAGQTRDAEADALAQIAQLRAELDAMRAELERTDRLATLGTNAAAVAHELNNLLTPILSYAQMARRCPDDAELVGKAILRAETGATRAAEIVSAILDVARGDQAVDGPGGQIAGPAPTGTDRTSGGPASESCPTSGAAADVSACLDAALACLARPPEKDGVRLDRSVPTGLAARIRPIALEQVLINTLMNAVDAMRPGPGTISVRGWCSTWNIEQGELTTARDAGTGSPTPSVAGDAIHHAHGASASADDGGGVVVIEIADDGPGVPTDILADVFRPMVTRKQPGAERPGTGLGLAICQRAVREAGGAIWLHSSPTDGTRVRIVLEAASGAEPSDTSAS
jgi:signal transduction histidine kinase